jgi:phosphoribosylamine--glycine ligase
MMKILVIGAGGREHALCWRLAQSPMAPKIYCAPGNPGTAFCGTNIPIQAGDLKGLRAFAREEAIDLTVVGPEAPLCAGIRELFEESGLKLAGPTAGAARLEGSKAFAKAFMERNRIPTAPFGIFEDPAGAAAYIDAHPEALVVKADGLAAGKGVFVCSEPDEAKAKAAWLIDGGLGEAGRRIVVESKLTGEEASFIVITDGERICALESSQDHKAAFDGDKGPNTGGMGAYSPAPVLTPEIQQRVMERVVAPAIRGMAAEGNPYRGFFYVGLMIDQGDPSVLEFNCRLGDPETQPLLARLRDDLVPVLVGVAEGRLPKLDLEWDSRTALCVVMAAEGYPGAYEKGRSISGLEQAEAIDGVVVFHAGTAREGERIVTAGGRVLGVTALGEGTRSAQERAYRASALISWDGVHYRRDIGYRALA